MAPKEPDEVDIGAPGLAAGPGPTPPGLDDGTPRPTRRAQGEDAAQPAARQGDEARVAERSAGTRADELGRPASKRRPSPKRSAKRRR